MDLPIKGSLLLGYRRSVGRVSMGGPTLVGAQVNCAERQTLHEIWSCRFLLKDKG